MSAMISRGPAAQLIPPSGRRDSGFHDVGRRREIEIACGQVNDLATLVASLQHLSAKRCRRRGVELLNFCRRVCHDATVDAARDIEQISLTISVISIGNDSCSAQPWKRGSPAAEPRRLTRGAKAMSAPQIIRTPSGEELVVLPRAEYEALIERANHAAEDADDVAIYDARKAELAAGGVVLLPPEVGAAILRGESRLKAIRNWRGKTQQ
jgi:hypothetical protein